MAHIDISRTHALGLAGARHAAQEVADRLHAEHGVRSEWHGNTLQVTGSGFHGQLDASETTVRVTARLGFFLGAAKVVVRKEIEQELDRAILQSS